MKRHTLGGLALAAVISIGATGPGLSVDSGGGSDSSGSSSPQWGSGPGLSEARNLVTAGSFGEAIPILEELTESSPNDPDVFNLLGYSLRKTGQYGPAEENYLEALRLDPGHLGANEYLGELYVETGRIGMAEERLVVLQAACGAGCEEADELAEAIAGAH
jgi:Flp pilus assembly protein TadD